MKKLFLTGMMLNLAFLIIGVTWIAPIENRQDRGELASAATVPPSASPAALVAAPVVAGGPVIVSLDQWSITPQASQAAAGPVTFTVTNQGTMIHEFVVMRTDTPAGALPITGFEHEKARVNEDTAGTNVGETGDLAAGKTKTVTIDLQAGHYVFMCNLPAHYGLGMHFDFTVV